MCFCDGLDFLIVNKTNGKKRFIKGDENLVDFFKDHYSLPCLFHRLLKKEYVRLDNVLYQILYNNHPECQRVKMELVKMLGIEDPGLWRICPDKYRYLLHHERQQSTRTLTI